MYHKVVVLPYNLLLQKQSREALGVDITDQVVIIDEAHSLSCFTSEMMQSSQILKI